MELNKDLPSITSVSRRESRLHILEIIGNAGIGGMESYIKNFISHLPANQFRVTCICPNESEFTSAIRQLGVEDVFITPIEDDPCWRSVQLVAEVARLNQIDVLHAHMPKAHVLAGIAGSLIRKPVVATVHGMNVTSHELGITRAVGSHLFTNCQEAYTQALAMGVEPDRVNLIRNGVDLTVFKPGRTSNTLRESIGISNDAMLVGFAGRLEQEKGPDMFIRAADVVHQHCPDAHFVVVGDGVMRGRLQEMCSHLQLKQHVHFTGWMSTDEVYPSLDVLAHTSRSDGTSLVLLEAMACECPTVGLAVGGVREIIEHESTGFLVGAGDWEKVGDRILQLLEKPKLRQSMSAAARLRVEQYFNIKSNTLQTAEMLRDIAFPGVNGHNFANTTTLSREIGGRKSVDN